MTKQPIPWKILLALPVFALALAASPSHADCGDSILDAGEDCDGGSCCDVDCKFTMAGTECRAAVNPSCDVAEVCDGSTASCPDDVLFECSDSDEIACTVPTCTEGGECIEADECIQICRGSGYWATHSGEDKEGDNVGQSVLDQAGPLLVCGESISKTSSIGDLQSALEALCVRTKGVKQRQLYRKLVTTALNCAISEGGDCDDVLARFVDVSFRDCSDICTGEEVIDGPSASDCRKQLGCFNKGGRLVDGSCALGTCESEAKLSCGASYGDCPDFDEAPQACVPFEGNCSAEEFCQELDAPALVCPQKKRATSPKTCRDARKNDCTIDDCAAIPD